MSYAKTVSLLNTQYTALVDRVKTDLRIWDPGAISNKAILVLSSLSFVKVVMTSLSKNVDLFS